MKVESLFQMMKSMVSLYGIASSAIHCIVLGMYDFLHFSLTRLVEKCMMHFFFGPSA